MFRGDAVSGWRAHRQARPRGLREDTIAPRERLVRPVRRLHQRVSVGLVAGTHGRVVPLHLMAGSSIWRRPRSRSYQGTLAASSAEFLVGRQVTGWGGRACEQAFGAGQVYPGGDSRQEMVEPRSLT